MMTQRNFLRKQVIEYKELNGLRKGCEVSAKVHNQLEQGTVKWIGTIKGTLYIGIEFERPVGNQFPETNGAAPFPCSLSHSRLVFPENVRTRSRNNIMDYQHQHCHQRNHHQQQHHHHPNQSQDDDNYLLRSVSTSFSCLGLSGSSSDIGTDTDTESSVMNQPSYIKHKSVVDICDGDNNDSGFLSTNSSSRLSSSSSPYSDTAIYANSEISVEQMNDFDEKLALFYKLCLQTKRLIKEFQVKYEGLVVNFRWEDVCAAVSLNLERLKTFRGEVRNKLAERLEQCKSEYQSMQIHSEFLMASDDIKMSREIQDLDHLFSSLDQEICEDIRGLEHFNAIYQALQDLLRERLSRFAAIKTRLVQVERNLVKDESSLCLRIKGLQSVLSVLERDHDCVEKTEIYKLVGEVQQSNDHMDISRVLSQAQDLILAEKQLLDEVKTKRALLIESKNSYSIFLTGVSRFQTWYNDYMNRLNATKVTGLDFDTQHATLVKEREEKRMEFFEILAAAKSLRASIFDYSAVDEKIETLQDQWKSLVEKVYRVRSRKTV